MQLSNDTKNNLNFALLPVISEAGIYIRLDDDVHDFFVSEKKLSEVFERAESALMFFALANRESENWRSSAYLRAGLNEYYSIEDAARRDWKKSNTESEPPKIRDSKNPLIHAMYILRHANVHACISKTISEKIQVVWREQEFDLDRIILEKNTLQEISDTQAAKKHYTIEQLKKTSEWINSNQMTFGITHIFFKGISAYCRELKKSFEAMV